MIYALYGAAAAGKDELHRQAAILAPDQVARIALGDAIKSAVDADCQSRYGISALTADHAEKSVIRPYLEASGQLIGPQLLPTVIQQALTLSSRGMVVFVPRVQNAGEMAMWVGAGAQAVLVVRDGTNPATEQERLDIQSIECMGIMRLVCAASDLDGVRRNAEELLKRAGVRL